VINEKVNLRAGALAVITMAVAALAVAACSGPASSPPPSTDEVKTLTHTLTWQQDAGSETLRCHTFKLDNDGPIEISRIQFLFGQGSHHVHIYRSDMPADDGVQDCWSGIAWPRWSLVVGAQTQPLDWTLPDGLTLPLAAHQQLLVQVHWLNGSSAPINPSIDLVFSQAAQTAGHVGVTFGVNKQVTMRPGQSKTVGHFCPLPDGSELIAMMGHFHALGRHYSVAMRDRDQPSGTTIYEAQDENTLVFKAFDPLLPVPAGAGLDFTCDFTNYHDFEVDWGADTTRQEHCNMAAYYYPADDDYDFCIKELDDVPPLAALTAASERLMAGDETTVTVRASSPVETDTDVALAAADATALAVPGLVTILAGASEATFTARALRPAPPTAITATLGTSAQSTAISVAGLVLSELLVAPGDAAGGPWIELANDSAMPIDLSQYAIGAGHASYAEIAIPLGTVLPPHGCTVVAAPELASAPQAAEMDQAGGVALFDAAAATGPIDAVVYGDGTDALVGPDGQPAPAVATPPAGSSLARLADGAWHAELVPSPQICEVAP
jgi:hypothetical protein